MHENIAIRTREHISIFHTGITGSLIQGLDNGLFQRISNDPLQALTGILYIAAAVYLTKQTYTFIQNKSKTIEKHNLMLLRHQHGNSGVSNTSYTLQQ